MPTLPGIQNGSIVVRITLGGASPAPTMSWRRGSGKSSITFVTESGGAESYRFFFGVGTDFEYELALLPAVDCGGCTADGFERGGNCGVASAFVEWRLGGWRRRVAGAPGQRVLLPLRDVEGARRVREDVRDAEVCVALVGDVLRDSEEQGDEGCVEGGAAVCSAGKGGAGGGGWGGGWRERFAVGRTWFVIRVPCTDRKISRRNW
jgi:hypothetical protein